MNFLDTYDLQVTRSATPNPDEPALAPAAPQPSLNEEVNQVIGQLGRFWGGFRKQSQTVLEAARKDLTQAVSQVQSELSKVTTGEVFQPLTSTSNSTSSVAESSTSRSASESVNEKASEASTAADGEKEGEATDSTTTPTPTTTSPGEPGTSFSPPPPPPPSGITTASALFAQLQAALPPAIVTAMQTNLQQTSETLAHTTEALRAQTGDTLRAAAEGLDLARLRNELARVQGVTLAQAEEYAHRSEALLREAVREAGEVLRDAVKVLPPEDGGAIAGGGMQGLPLLWDGADMWMLPAEGEAPRRTSESSARGETPSAVTTRAEALLRLLKRNPDIVRHNPEAEEGVKEKYVSWKEKEVDTLDGGVEGAEWKAKIDAMLEEPIDGSALKQLEQTLVPSEMTASLFWLRIFFRMHQIRSEEEKRKALMQSTTDNADEDFSWEDDEDEDSPTTSQPVKPAAADQAAAHSLALPSASTPGIGTPRVSSEDSFDLVSSASAIGEDIKQKASTQEDDGDSDWE